MGNAVMRYLNSDFLVFVRTGDRKHASTDANVKIVLINEQGQRSREITLDNILRDDFKTGASDTFAVRNLRDFGRIEKIEFWRDNAGVSPDWFVMKIMVENVKTNEMSIFPVFRWIKANYHYKICHLDTVLPQFDVHSEQRKMELEDKRKIYIGEQKSAGLPIMAKHLPTDEQFSFEYKWSIVKLKARLIATGKLVNIKAGNWTSFVDLFNVYTSNTFKKPKGVHSWKNDLMFGMQRLTGCNPNVIQLCQQIPEKLGVNDEMLESQLEGLTLDQAIAAKRLFYTDLEIMDNIKHKQGFEVCAPIALFFLDKDKQLIPIAIQLQQKKGPNNPIFMPTDPPGLWTLAKMWYNNADAAIHQSLTHLGFTHLIMEGVVLAIHRNISLSHPVFKLLAPHTLYLLAINARGLQFLISPGGWVDNTMNIGIAGMFDLIARGMNTWSFDIHGTLPAELKERGVDDPDILPYYPFRDDAILYYDIIKEYVTSYTKLYYDSLEKLTNDWEIQNWAEELARSKEDGGIGLSGTPLKDGKGFFNNLDELVMVLTCIVYTCSVGHAASNFPQYEEYGFPAHYPAYMKGPVPTSKDILVTEEDILKVLPDRQTTLDIMTVTKILSSKGTNSLGDFEVQYIFDPRAIPVVNKFRNDLRELGKIISERNKTRNPTYTYLEPVYVPNSISI